MKSLIFILTFALLIVGCKKEITPTPDSGAICNVKSPVDDIPWLKSEIAAVSNSKIVADYYVTHATYKGRDILWINICCPACNVLPPTARYCDGTIAGTLGTDIQTNELNRISTVWQTHNGVCIID